MVHRHGHPDDPEALEAADIEHAGWVLLFAASETDARADAVSLSVLERLHSHGVRCHLVVECVDNRNRPRLLGYYPAAVLVRPVRGYPEMLVRALAAPGTEQILENLFQREGVYPRRYDVVVDGLSWADVVTRTMTRGYGAPLAYLDANGEVVSCPAGDTAVRAQALFVIVDDVRPDPCRAAHGAFGVSPTRHARRPARSPIGGADGGSCRLRRRAPHDRCHRPLRASTR